MAVKPQVARGVLGPHTMRPLQPFFTIRVIGCGDTPQAAVKHATPSIFILISRTPPATYRDYDRLLYRVLIPKMGYVGKMRNLQPVTCNL